MPVRGSEIRDRLMIAAIVAAAVVAAVDPALAQAGPFGVGTPEAGAAVPSSGIFAWVAARQNEFYRGLTAGLRAMRADPNAGPGWCFSPSATASSMPPVPATARR
jgi:hypothetical protein